MESIRPIYNFTVAVDTGAIIGIIKSKLFDELAILVIILDKIWGCVSSTYDFAPS